MAIFLLVWPVYALSQVLHVSLQTSLFLLSCVSSGLLWLFLVLVFSAIVSGVLNAMLSLVSLNMLVSFLILVLKYVNVVHCCYCLV